MNGVGSIVPTGAISMSFPMVRALACHVEFRRNDVQDETIKRTSTHLKMPVIVDFVKGVAIFASKH